MNCFIFILTAGALFLAGCFQPASTHMDSAPKVAIEPWGFDLKAMDRSIQPGAVDGGAVVAPGLDGDLGGGGFFSGDGSGAAGEEESGG